MGKGGIQVLGIGFPEFCLAGRDFYDMHAFFCQQDIFALLVNHILLFRKDPVRGLTAAAAMISCWEGLNLSQAVFDIYSASVLR